MPPRPFFDRLENAHTPASRVLEEPLELERLGHPELRLHGRGDPVLRFRGTHEMDGDTVAGQDRIVRPVQALVHEGLVMSQKGLGGGFRLARNPEEISLYDVAEAFEHISRWSECFLGGICSAKQETCALHARWAPLREEYLEVLHQTSIADLVRKQEAVTH